MSTRLKGLLTKPYPSSVLGLVEKVLRDPSQTVSLNELIVDNVYDDAKGPPAICLRKDSNRQYLSTLNPNSEPFCPQLVQDSGGTKNVLAAPKDPAGGRSETIGADPFEGGKVALFDATGGDGVYLPRWGLLRDEQRLATKAVVFELTEDDWAGVTADLVDGKTYLMESDGLIYYKTPLLSTPQVERAMCKAIALAMYIGLPIVFEPVGSELGVTTANQEEVSYEEWIAKRVSAVFREFPDMVQLVRPEQLNLFLKIDDVRPTKFFEITQCYNAAMNPLCYRYRLIVTCINSFNSSTLANQKFIRSAKASIADTLLEKCHPQPVPEYEPVYDTLPLQKEKARIYEQTSVDCAPVTCSFVDIGLAKYPYALMSQVTNTLFLPGLPGSVQCKHIGDTQYVMFKSRDTSDLMANAGALAVAMAVSDIVVIPSGLPLDELIKTIKIARQNAPLLLNTKDAVIISADQLFRRLILACEPDVSRTEAEAAIQLLRSSICDLFPSWKGTVEYGLTPFDVYMHICQMPRSGTTDNTFRQTQLRCGVATFGSVNNCWEYCRLATTP